MKKEQVQWKIFGVNTKMRPTLWITTIQTETFLDPQNPRDISTCLQVNIICSFLILCTLFLFKGNPEDNGLGAGEQPTCSTATLYNTCYHSKAYEYYARSIDIGQNYERYSYIRIEPKSFSRPLH